MSALGQKRTNYCDAAIVRYVPEADIMPSANFELPLSQPACSRAHLSPSNQTLIAEPSFIAPPEMGPLS